MTRAGLAFALAVALPLGAAAQWTATERFALPLDGTPIALDAIAAPHEARAVRVRLSGTVTFGYDGSELDAMGRTVAGVRDDTAGPFVALPPGSVLVEGDPETHRYVFDVPRSEHMSLRFDALRLATRHLLTLSEARGHLVGAIEVEHLAPPAPPPPPPSAATLALREAEGVPALAWAGGGAGVLLLFGLGAVAARRRRDPIRALVRRAATARAAIGREVLALGPAFDPVAASAERLVEVARQHAAHHGSLEAAIARTRAMASSAAGARRATLSTKRAEVRARLAAVVARLEETATELAGRNADSARARGVDALVAELGADLDAAVAAEEELAL
ncbi:MAG: hypothetical protein KF729_09950 [Sandaracinaceae bacterium]|nr:hypothetical protein [Sandaracinaceae bacterium]